jgi:hypothetical protein
MYVKFKKTCFDCDNNNIDDFKNNTDIIGVIETVSKNVGDLYLSNILKYEVSKNINWTKIKKMNDIGNPKLYEFSVYDNILLLSPTTLRYIQYSLDILSYIKDNLKLHNLNIIEIGAGYGFQAVLLYELSNLFNIKINHYKIIDLEETNNLQKLFFNKIQDYIEFNIIDNISICDCNNIGTINADLFISNYALGEFDRDWQNYYIENVIKYIKHGFICWNFSVNNRKIHEYFHNIIKTIEEENPQTNCYPVKSYILKY